MYFLVKVAVKKIILIFIIVRILKYIIDYFRMMGVILKCFTEYVIVFNLSHIETLYRYRYETKYKYLILRIEDKQQYQMLRK